MTASLEPLAPEVQTLEVEGLEKNLILCRVVPLVTSLGWSGLTVHQEATRRGGRCTPAVCLCGLI